jgi:hypothetical protein
MFLFFEIKDYLIKLVISVTILMKNLFLTHDDSSFKQSLDINFIK